LLAENNERKIKTWVNDQVGERVQGILRETNGRCGDGSCGDGGGVLEGREWRKKGKRIGKGPKVKSGTRGADS